MDYFFLDDDRPELLIVLTDGFGVALFNFFADVDELTTRLFTAFVATSFDNI